MKQLCLEEKSSMKVLVVHNFHRSGSASGDDQVFKHETAMLKNAGIELLRYTIHTDEFDKKNKAGKLLASLDMFWSPKTYRDIQRICKEEKPDIVHVHTFFRCSLLLFCCCTPKRRKSDTNTA